ncbi:MAG: DUF1772 domain-containing protein [Sphingobacteriaceae bacterium]|nr:MAG: DUF1772 domain-containing protein [Sphingobacteriaceae bacterium]
MRLTFNILAISGSAMFAGVLLAIGLILGGYWKSLPAPDFVNVFNDNIQFIPRAIAPVTIIALVGLAGSVWLSRGDKDARTLWLGAAACIVVLLVFTMIWFAPTNAQFVARSLPIEQVPAKRDMWLMLHTFRIALAALASILGVIAGSR